MSLVYLKHEINKGLPSAIKAGGGGVYGIVRRGAANAGQKSSMFQARNWKPEAKYFKRRGAALRIVSREMLENAEQRSVKNGRLVKIER